MSSTGTPYSTNPNQSGCKYCNAPYTLTFPSSATSNEAQVIFYGLSIIIFAVLLFLPLSSKWSVHGTYASYPPTKSNNILYLTVTLSYLFYSLLQFILISLEWADVLVTLKFLVYNVVVDFIYRVADVIVLAIMLMIVQRRYFAMAGGRRGVSWGIMGLLAAVNAASYAVNTASTAYSIKDGSHAGLLEVGRWVLLAYEAVYLLVVLGLGAIPVGFMGREERSKRSSILLFIIAALLICTVMDLATIARFTYLSTQSDYPYNTEENVYTNLVIADGWIDLFFAWFVIGGIAAFCMSREEIDVGRADRIDAGVEKGDGVGDAVVYA